MLLRKIYFILFIILGLSSLYSSQLYKLKKGDTLYSISKEYKISVDELVSYNKIKDINSISVGTEIAIPKDEVGVTPMATEYVVKKGDTLFSISRKFNLTLSQLLDYNELTSDSIISLGQVLKLVNNEILTEDIPRTDYPMDIPYWPVHGEITKYSGRIQGVVIEGISGDYIKAVSDGKVIWYDSYKGIGKVVLIEGSNGFDYLYGTKESLNVEIGGKISAGDRLGRLKDNSTSIIFSVFKDGEPLENISEAPR